MSTTEREVEKIGAEEFSEAFVVSKSHLTEMERYHKKNGAYFGFLSGIAWQKERENEEIAAVNLNAEQAIMEAGRLEAELAQARGEKDKAVDAFDFANEKRIEAERESDALRSQIRSLLNKVNVVTAYHRHGNKVSAEMLDELANRQIEVEAALEAK